MNQSTKDAFILLSGAILTVVVGMFAFALPNYDHSLGVWCKNHTWLLAPPFFVAMFGIVLYAQKCDQRDGIPN